MCQFSLDPQLSHCDTLGMTRSSADNRTTTSELARPFDAPDYHDHFVLQSAEPIDNIDSFVERLALRQPRWLTGVSMSITKRSELEASVAAVIGRSGDAIGNWLVVEQTDTAITFAEDMRIMRYRVSYALRPNGEVDARTEVEQQTRWLGPVYWTLATPLHKRFLQRMLRNAGGRGSTTRAEGN